MSIRLACLALILALGSGCAKVANLYPTSGPMAEAGQVQPFRMLMNGLDTNGECELTLPTWEACRGNYAVVLNQSQFWGSESGYNWQQSWGSAWGSNFRSYQSRAGIQFGMASLACAQGTILEIRFIVSGYDGHGIGLAKDNKGNVFKVYL